MLTWLLQIQVVQLVHGQTRYERKVHPTVLSLVTCFIQFCVTFRFYSDLKNFDFYFLVQTVLFYCCLKIVV